MWLFLVVSFYLSVVFCVDPICKDIPANGLTVDPYSCEGFNVCNNGVATQKRCPSEKRFSETKLTCVNKTQNPCTDDIICPQNTVILLPSLTSCEEYYLCINGIVMKQTCPPGTYLNANTEKCVDPNESNCNINESTTSDPTITTTESSTEVPPDYDCPEVDEDLKPIFFASSVKCQDFYWCHNGEGLIFTCPGNLHWNQNKYACDEPGVVNCTIRPFNNCPATGQHLIPHPTNCEYFFFCNQGVKIRQKCPNFQHFDKYDKNCKLQSSAKC